MGKRTGGGRGVKVYWGKRRPAGRVRWCVAWVGGWGGCCALVGGSSGCGRGTCQDGFPTGGIAGCTAPLDALGCVAEGVSADAALLSCRLSGASSRAAKPTPYPTGPPPRPPRPTHHPPAHPPTHPQQQTHLSLFLSPFLSLSLLPTGCPSCARLQVEDEGEGGGWEEAGGSVGEEEEGGEEGPSKAGESDGEDEGTSSSYEELSSLASGSSGGSRGEEGEEGAGLRSQAGGSCGPGRPGSIASTYWRDERRDRKENLATIDER